MTTRRKNADEDEVQLSDGAATVRLREVESQAMVSRRGVLWRAGLATAGVGVLAALNEPQADAVTGGSFFLGQANTADATTALAATATTLGVPSILMSLDGTNTTVTSLFVQGPAGGSGISAQSGGTGVSGSSTAASGVSGSSSSGSGVSGSSSSGSGVSGSSSSGAGVKATSTSGPALSVVGRTHFSRSGAATVAQGSKTKTVTVSGMTSSSLVLVTLQVSVAGLYVAGAVPGSGKFTVHLNKSAPTTMRFAWFALSG
jgi:hypothetical protein